MSKSLSLADKIRERLNDNKEGKIITQKFTADDVLLHVQDWIQLQPFFKQATGGEGFPCGHISQIIGKPDSGKTTLLMHGMVSTQKAGGIAYLIDSEHKFSLQRFALMGGKPEDLVILQGNSLEEDWTNIDNVLKMTAQLREEGFKEKMMMGWDSIAASTPQALIDSEAGDAHMSVEAKINNKNVRRLRQAIKATNLAVVGINHYYMTVPRSPYEQPELVIKGGEELSFLSTLILRTKQGAEITREIKGEKQKLGRYTKFFVHKGHFHGRTINKEVAVVDIGILESDEALAEYKKSLRGEY
jgi:RecA/RadA recombinase